MATPPALATMVSRSGHDMWLAAFLGPMSPAAPGDSSVFLLSSGDSFDPSCDFGVLLTLAALPDVSEWLSDWLDSQMDME